MAEYARDPNNYYLAVRGPALSAAQKDVVQRKARRAQDESNYEAKVRFHHSQNQSLGMFQMKIFEKA